MPVVMSKGKANHLKLKPHVLIISTTAYMQAVIRNIKKIHLLNNAGFISALKIEPVLTLGPTIFTIRFGG